MARYLKLGASRSSDRDTSLFLDPQEEAPNDSGKLKHPTLSILRRAQSTREQRSRNFSSSSSAPAPGGKMNPQEFHRNVEQRFEEQVSSNSYFLRRARSSREQQHKQEISDKISDKFKSKQVIRPALVRAQSLRYNRIVSADEEDEPPRHSSVERSTTHGSLADPGGKNSSSRQTDDSKSMVRVSASYQTREGEILSIECSQCGRWLGTVNVEQGLLVKLCQICHPGVEQLAGDGALTAAAAPAGSPVPDVGGSRDELKRRSSPGSGFIRGLRKMLGLRKTTGHGL